jgi:5'-AMP-activated protein kinase catalytic alpha subunit
MTETGACSPANPSVPSSGVLCPNKIGPYILADIIGEGGFSVVRSAIHESTNATVACKIIPKRRLVTMGIADSLQREAEILRRLRHPAVCAVYDILYDAINCYVIMELCPEGSLRTRILNQSTMSEQQAKPIFWQLVNAVAFIHSCGVAHRDIKPENILIDHSDHIKLIDFGLSNFITEDDLFSTRVGSPCYAAPEWFGLARYSGIRADAWSSGVVLFTMLTGRLPWSGVNEQQVIDKITKAEYYVPESLSERCRDLIKKILELDPERRFTPEQILNHPWLAGASLSRQGPIAQQRRELTKCLHSCEGSKIRAVRWSGFGDTALMLIRKGRLNRDNRASLTRQSSFGG